MNKLEDREKERERGGKRKRESRRANLDLKAPMSAMLVLPPGGRRESQAENL